jgi:hypothetical protein
MDLRRRSSSLDPLQSRVGAPHHMEAAGRAQQPVKSKLSPMMSPGDEEGFGAPFGRVIVECDRRRFRRGLRCPGCLRRAIAREPSGANHEYP